MERKGEEAGPSRGRSQTEVRTHKALGRPGGSVGANAARQSPALGQTARPSTHPHVLARRGGCAWPQQGYCLQLRQGLKGLRAEVCCLCVS